MVGKGKGWEGDGKGMGWDGRDGRDKRAMG